LAKRLGGKFKTAQSAVRGPDREASQGRVSVREPKLKQGYKEMPRIEFQGRIIECRQGDNLRRVLMRAKLPPYNGIAKAIHCRGLGTCGTCSLEIDGDVSEPTAVEKWRLDFPPHRLDSGLRLACQCRVLGDLTLIKHNGMWGNQITIDSADSGNSPDTDDSPDLVN